MKPGNIPTVMIRVTIILPKMIPKMVPKMVPKMMPKNAPRSPMRQKRVLPWELATTSDTSVSRAENVELMS